MALLALLAAPCWGQNVDRFMLSEEDFRGLPSAAQEEYLVGVDALDHVDFLGAHNHFRRAAELAPDSAPMQLKLYELAQLLSRTNQGRRSEDFLIVGREALERVANSSLSTPDQQRRAEAQLGFLTRQFEETENRQLQRRLRGRTFMHALTLQQDWFMVGQRFPDLKRAILTQPGSGDPVTRSEVVLIDEAGHLYHPDMTPFIDANGRHLTQADMADATIEEAPDEEFFSGMSEQTTASAAPGEALDALRSMPTAAPAPAEPAETAGPALDTAEMEEGGDVGTGGSLSPAVMDEEEISALEEAPSDLAQSPEAVPEEAGEPQPEAAPSEPEAQPPTAAPPPSGDVFEF
jgi:hypothetical protein